MELEDETTEELDEITSLWQSLQLRDGGIENDATIFDYIEIDEDVAIAEEPTMEDAVYNHRTSDELEDEVDEEASSDETEYYGLL